MREPDIAVGKGVGIVGGQPDHITPGPGLEIGDCVGHHRTRPGRDRDQIIGIAARAAGQGVGGSVFEEMPEHIVPSPAVQYIRTGPTIEVIVAGAAGQAVIGRSSAEPGARGRNIIYQPCTDIGEIQDRGVCAEQERFDRCIGIIGQRVLDCYLVGALCKTDYKIRSHGREAGPRKRIAVDPQSIGFTDWGAIVDRVAAVARSEYVSVIAGAAGKQIITDSPGQCIIAGTAIQHIVARAAVQKIIAFIAIKRLVKGEPS